MKIKQSLFLTMLLLSSLSASASKAVSLERTVTLLGGREVTVRLVGDENLHFLVTQDGDVVVRDNGVYRLATTFEVENIKAKAERDGAVQRAKMASLIARGITNDSEGINANIPFPHTGTPKVLVIMTDFTDTNFTYSKTEVDSLFNAKEYSTKPYTSYGSLAQYFADCSYGAFRPQFDVVGPYKLSKPLAYYGNSNGDNNNRALFSEACKLADAAGVDFSQYDSNNDGYVDAVYVFAAGYGEHMSGIEEDLWPQSGVDPGIGTFGGKKVYRYIVSSEKFGYPGVAEQLGMQDEPLSGIGVMTHEFSHCLGLPDFYPTVSWTVNKNGTIVYDVSKYDNQSMENWDIMDNGGNVRNGYDPTPYSAWERELMGWGEKMEILNRRCNVSLVPLAYGGSGKRIVNDNDATGHEFWILENWLSGTGTGWYRSIPGSGMLVTHINYSYSSFSNFSSPNNNAGQPRITILPADGNLYSSYRTSLPTTDEDYMSNKQLKAHMKTDVYPQTIENLTVTSLTDYKAYTGTVDKPLTDITKLADGTVEFKFMGGALLLGDVNMDGRVSVADANDIVNHCLGKYVTPFDGKAADVNGDGRVTVADANMVINITLGK